MCEWGPQGGVILPALLHQSRERGGAAVGQRRPAAVHADVEDDLQGGGAEAQQRLSNMTPSGYDLQHP